MGGSVDLTKYTLPVKIDVLVEFKQQNGGCMKTVFSFWFVSYNQ